MLGLWVRKERNGKKIMMQSIGKFKPQLTKK